MALRANMRRIWIPEPSTPLRSANERTREPGATYPPPLRRRVPPPDPDCGRQAAARGGVVPTRRCGRRSALSRVPQRPEGGVARRQRPSPRRFVPDWRAPSLAQGQETSRRRNLPPIRGYRPLSARNRALPSVPYAPPLSQVRGSGAAHSSQNFALALFSCWHCWHFIEKVPRARLYCDRSVAHDRRQGACSPINARRTIVAVVDEV